MEIHDIYCKALEAKDAAIALDGEQGREVLRAVGGKENLASEMRELMDQRDHREGIWYKHPETVHDESAYKAVVKSYNDGIWRRYMELKRLFHKTLVNGLVLGLGYRGGPRNLNNRHKWIFCSVGA